MTKIAFLMSLHDKLSGLPRDEVEERLAFYSEMIEDRMEEGLSEEEAVTAIGSVDEIAEQIASDIPFTKIAKEKIKSCRKLRAWEIVLLVLGSPVWLALLIAAFAVIISAYAVLWSVIVSFWAVFTSVAACSFCGIVAGVVFAVCSDALTGIALVGGSVVCAGLAIFLFFGCKAATKGTVCLTKHIAAKIKKDFTQKGVVQ